MKIKEVLTKWNAKIPFPWTVEKIHKAGFDICEVFPMFIKELKKCEDVDSYYFDTELFSATFLTDVREIFAAKEYLRILKRRAKILQVIAPLLDPIDWIRDKLKG